jgi:hypothetical protein
LPFVFSTDLGPADLDRLADAVVDGIASLTPLPAR